MKRTLRERDAEKKKLKAGDKALGALLAEAEKLGTAVSQTGISHQYARAAALATEQPLYREGVATLHKVSALATVTVRRARGSPRATAAARCGSKCG